MRSKLHTVHRIVGLLAALTAALPAAAGAQQDTTKLPSGVRLGTVYQTSYRQKLAVRPFTAPPERIEAARQVFEIVRRDLDYSDRFQMVEVPPTMAAGPIRYEQWDDLGVVYLVTAELSQAEGKDRLTVALHDAVFGSVKNQQAFYLPDPAEPGFRMAVHSVADEIVRWATGQPGMAASRIAVVRQGRGGYELMVVDADGENLQRVFSTEEILLGPAWSPDGKKLAFALGSAARGWRVVERELESGETRTVSAAPGLNYTPAYSPDGMRLAFGVSVSGGASTEIREYDFRTRSVRRLTRVRNGADLSPTYSPNGRSIAFNSDRVGQPHIYVVELEGGEPTMLSPYAYPEPGHYTSPDWSPTGSLVAFHGRSRGNMQLMVADASRPGTQVQQLTVEGESEDPSWAPDGRHLVFSGVRAEGVGLYVIDTTSGRIRPLVLGGRYLVPDWSPALWTASAAAARAP